MHPRQLKEFWEESLLNKASVVWASCVLVSGCLLLLCMIGAFNGAMSEDDLKATTEACQQILTALMTVPVLVIIPSTANNTYLFFNDYYKGYKEVREQSNFLPHQFDGILVLKNLNIATHIMVCFAMWFFGPSTRPMPIILVCLPLTIISGTAAAIWEGSAKQQALERKEKGALLDACSQLSDAVKSHTAANPAMKEVQQEPQQKIEDLAGTVL
ncbi:hypothetical protein CYMTET_42164 [Cymbomonas tetramitiformis]|uniref:Uncharacterized protein n=1 Tax=Cymbomonas tetramitiformis TaxID=36881 RepID=A0AAE0C6S4_9CHLO|nr:hypothetical protein CYMTET_42164 [Cymbomonas tetramitiformis]